MAGLAPASPGLAWCSATWDTARIPRCLELHPGGRSARSTVTDAPKRKVEESNLQVTMPAPAFETGCRPRSSIFQRGSTRNRTEIADFAGPRLTTRPCCQMRMEGIEPPT